MKTLIECQKRGVQGWKCGEEGTCFVGFDAKQKALAEAANLKAEEWRISPKPSTLEFLEKHQEAREAREELVKRKVKKSTKNRTK